MKNVILSAVINPEDDGVVALCPELDIASQGSSTRGYKKAFPSATWEGEK